MKKIICASLFAAAMLIGTSCKAPKNVSYFQDTDVESVVNVANMQSIKAQPGDKLTIVVNSKDAEVSNLFNLPVYSQQLNLNSNISKNNATQLKDYRASSSTGMAGYTIDEKGCIDFPVLGSLCIEGMTRSEIAGYVKGELMGRDLVKDPTVLVEFLNTGVNILGEVLNPGRYEINTDNLTVLEALAMAGDLALTGRRDNVRVLREENGKINVYKINLLNLSEAASSPAYCLRQNDVIYVEPNEMQRRQTTVNGNNTLSTSFWISVASLVTTAVTTIGVFIK